MAKYKIGITEAGDAGLDLSWEYKLPLVDGAVLITKNITDDFMRLVAKHRDKLIVHVTMTGYGGGIYEQNVPCVNDMISKVQELDLPRERVVIRVDPIIPSGIGAMTAYRVIMRMMELGYSRYRVSIIDMYPHVRERFKDSHVIPPYGKGFSPDRIHIDTVNGMLADVKRCWPNALNKNPDDLRIEACAEPQLTEAIQCGCISSYDLNLLGLEPEEKILGYQRRACLCYVGKTELLENKKRCGHGCLYCYWKD